MSQADIVRAWRDEEYRLGLTDAQRASLPAHPIGAIELPAAALNPALESAHSRDNSFCTLSCSCWCLCG
jgi:mersacidin/lichenicidin family type 2 lantibiotic